MAHVLAGLIGAFVAATVWFVVGLMLPIAIGVLVTSSEAGRVDPVSAPFGGESVLVAALVGFAAGVYWRVRQPSSRPA